MGTDTKWNAPQDVDVLTVAFPVNVCGTLLPSWEEIPEEFKKRDNEWCQKVSELFFRGGTLPPVREGIDVMKAGRHLSALLGSFEPKHQHKEAGVAWLMSLWCRPLT